MRARRGFSLIELLMVFVIFGLMVAIGVPRFVYVRQTLSVKGAKDELATYISTARAASIRRGREARFILSGNQIRVMVDSSGTYVTLGQPIRLDTSFAVSITPTTDTVRFNSRGIAVAGVLKKFVVTRSTAKDSVCVSRLGVIMKDNCTDL